MCQCDPPARAAFREVMKEGNNKGRHFYACRKPQGSQCGYFEWADGGSGGGGGGGGGAAPSQAAGNDRNCFKVRFLWVPFMWVLTLRCS